MNATGSRAASSSDTGSARLGGTGVERRSEPERPDARSDEAGDFLDQIHRANRNRRLANEVPGAMLEALDARVWSVPSQTTEGAMYYVLDLPLGMFCTCPSRHTCKHIRLIEDGLAAKASARA